MASNLDDHNWTVYENPEDICYTQATCSRRFNDGWLVTTLEDELRQGVLGPLVHLDLVLPTTEAWIRRTDLKKPGCKHTLHPSRLFTYDHRRQRCYDLQAGYVEAIVVVKS